MVSEELEAATEELNEALCRAERLLFSMDLGVTARIQLQEGEQLVWGKHDRCWRFLVEDGASRQPLENSSRRVRIEAAGRLADLMAAIQAAQADQIRLVREATARVRAFTQALPGGGS